MSKFLSVATVSLFFLLASCTSSETALQKTLEDHPEILVSAIKKNPEKIMAALQVAAQEMQNKDQQKEALAEAQRAEQELRNPLVPEIQEGRQGLGLVNSPITIVNYTDFQCPYCSRGYQTMEQVRKTYGDKVRIIVKNLPLSNHPMAMPAASRFEALMLVKPDYAWAFYHEVFAHQDKLNGGGEKYLDSIVTKLGADLKKVKQLMASSKVRDLIESDMQEAEKFNISGTPGFIVAGVSVRGAYPFDTFKQIIDKKLQERN
jgi:protein-disulfide isomerase